MGKSTRAPAARKQALRQWFAFLGGGFAWTAHLLSIYAIGEFGCASGFDSVYWLGISAVAWLLTAVSMVLFAVAIAAAVIARRDSREFRGSPEGPDDGGSYLSWFGRVLGPLFAVIIAVESIPIFFYLDGC